MSQQASAVLAKSLSASNISVGDPVTPMDINLTSTLIVAGAIATRDFMPVHHDKAYAQAQGAPDMFINIWSTNAYVARFVTDWAGPQTFVKNIKIRLGVPAIPNQVLSFRGEVLSRNILGEECEVEVSVIASNDMGEHATGTVVLVVPA